MEGYSSLTGKDISTLSYPPTFNDGDMSSIQISEVDLGFADPTTLKWGLFGQGWWAWRKQRKAIIKAGFTGYDKDSFPSDGFTLYFEMQFNSLYGDGDQIGIDIPLPNGDGTNS